MDLSWEYMYKIICVWMVTEDMGWRRSSEEKGYRKKEKGYKHGGQRVRRKTGICTAEGMNVRKTEALLLDFVTRSSLGHSGSICQ